VCGVVLLRGKQTAVVGFGAGSEELLSLPTSSTVSLSDFHRSESKDGKLVWDVTAIRGEYYPENGRANLKTPAIKLFSEEGSSITINAPVGLVLLENEALREARVTGGARVVHQSGVVVESPELTYSAGTLEISTDKTATIKGDGVVTTGNILSFNTDTQKLRLSNGVRTTFTGRKNDLSEKK
jgi:LPS export ABC transporter protein LptC